MSNEERKNSKFIFGPKFSDIYIFVLHQLDNLVCIRIAQIRSLYFHLNISEILSNIDLFSATLT